MLSPDKFMQILEHPVGQFVLDKIDDTVLFTLAGNAIAKLGVPEADVCKILNVLEQAKPEGGYVTKLRDPEFRENLRSFIALFQDQDKSIKVHSRFKQIPKDTKINPNNL